MTMTTVEGVAGYIREVTGCSREQATDIAETIYQAKAARRRYRLRTVAGDSYYWNGVFEDLAADRDGSYEVQPGLIFVQCETGALVNLAQVVSVDVVAPQED